MTVAVMVKVYDGMVLATDSATTVPLQGGAQVYNSADKIFNLHRELPIAAMTWGLGQVGPASISTVAKDLRERFMGYTNHGTADWSLDKESYTIEFVATRLSEMFHDLLKPVSASLTKDCLGMLVVGYSAGSSQPEAWLLYLDGMSSNPPTPTLVASNDDSGYLVFAQSRAADRLFRGSDAPLREALLNVIPPQHHNDVNTTLDAQALQPVIPPMPFPDAIMFARFIVDVTAGFSHFLLGPDTVGGPTEVAGINRHEGFKWVARKHYYSLELNAGVNQ